MAKEFGSDRELRALLAEQIARYWRFYYRIAFGILRHGAAAEDACQQAFATAMERLADLRGAESLRFWFTQIVTRESMQVRRRRDAEERVLARSATRSMVVSPGDADWMIREAVIDAVEKLEEPTRSIVTLRLLDGMSGNEVKDLLSCSAAQVSRHMHLGMEILREVLRDWDPGVP